MRYDDCWQDDANDTGTATAGNAVTLTYAADTETRPDASYRKYLMISNIEFSYTVAGAGGLTITDGGTTVFQMDITSAGPGSVRFFPARRFTAGSAVVITLAGVATSVGKLNVHKRFGGSR